MKHEHSSNPPLHKTALTAIPFQSLMHRSQPADSPDPVLALEGQLGLHAYKPKLSFDDAVKSPCGPGQENWVVVLHLNGVRAIRGRGDSPELAKQAAAAEALANIETGKWIVHSHKLEEKKVAPGNSIGATKSKH